MSSRRFWLKVVLADAKPRRRSVSLAITLAVLLASCGTQQPTDSQSSPADDATKLAQSTTTETRTSSAASSSEAEKKPVKSLPPAITIEASSPTVLVIDAAAFNPMLPADDGLLYWSEAEGSSEPHEEDASPQKSAQAPQTASGEASSENTAAAEVMPYDPFAPINEKILALNVFFDDHVGAPVSAEWGVIVPLPVRLHIRNFFRNTGEPKNFVNCALQRRFRDAGITLERFSLNTTLGMGGFFDIAQSWFGLERKSTDFGLTAAHHSVTYGPYLMAPGGGPTSVRDAAGGAVDGHLNPLGTMVYVLPSLVYLPISASLALINAMNERSLDMESLKDVDRYTVDLYGAVQDSYYQKRSHDQPPPGSSE